jgi:hypothetical protein
VAGKSGGGTLLLRQGGSGGLKRQRLYLKAAKSLRSNHSPQRGHISVVRGIQHHTAAAVIIIRRLFLVRRNVQENNNGTTAASIVSDQMKDKLPYSLY